MNTTASGGTITTTTSAPASPGQRGRRSKQEEFAGYLSAMNQLREVVNQLGGYENTLAALNVLQGNS